MSELDLIKMRLMLWARQSVAAMPSLERSIQDAIRDGVRLAAPKKPRRLRP